MSTPSINLIKQAERQKQMAQQSNKNRLEMNRPQNMNFRFPNSEQLKTDPLIAVIGNSDEKTSSNLKVDDCDTQSLSNHSVGQKIEEGKQKTVATRRLMNHKSMQIVSQDESPLIKGNINNVRSPEENKNESLNQNKIQILQDQTGFSRDELGFMTCENLKITEVAQKVYEISEGAQSFYLMSKNQLDLNIHNYQETLSRVNKSLLMYSVVANHNFNVLKHIANKGCGAVLSSSVELQAALMAQFKRERMIFKFKGSASQNELNLAVENQVAISIDQQPQLEYVIKAASQCKTKARIFVQVSPELEDPIESIGNASSKSETQGSHVSFLNIVKDFNDQLELVGIQLQIKSCESCEPLNFEFRDYMERIIELVKLTRDDGHRLENLYIQGDFSEVNLSKQDFIKQMQFLTNECKLGLIFDPGNILNNNVWAIVTRVQSTQKYKNQDYLIVDDSLKEMIAIETLQQLKIEVAQKQEEQPMKEFDISFSFFFQPDLIQKEVALPQPNLQKDDILVFFNGIDQTHGLFNMKPSCLEFWVNNHTLEQIRKPLSMETYLTQFDTNQIENKPRSQVMALSGNSSNSSKDYNSHVGKQSSKPYCSSFFMRQSNIDLDSFTIDQIDEKDEENCNSPMIFKRKGFELSALHNSRNANESRQKFLSDDQNNNNENKKESQSYDFLFTENNGLQKEGYDLSESSGSSKSIEKPFDSEEEDLIFMKNLEQDQTCEEFTKLNEQPKDFIFNNLKIPKRCTQSQDFVPEDFKLPYKDKRLYDQKDYSEELNRKSPVQNSSPIQKSPSFGMENTFIELIKSPPPKAQRTAIKDKVEKSPIHFLSQRKIFQKPILDIKAKNYDLERYEEIDESSITLTRNGGGEIDIQQMTSNQKGPIPQNDFSSPSKYADSPDLTTFKRQSLAYSQSDSKSKDFAFSMDRSSILQGLRQPKKSSIVEDSLTQKNGTTGLGSAGLRLRLHDSDKKNQQNSSTSSKRDQFRNRLKSGPGSLSGFQAFQKFKDGNSSVNSRMVLKLTGNNKDTDIISQQELEFQNEFERNYKELEQLGQGGSSVVSKCEHKISKTIRAVKIVRNDDPEYIETAKREYEILKDIKHPHIVKMYDCIHDESKGSLYFIMDYIEGQTLEDYVKNQDKQNLIKESLVHSIFKQIFQAVEYLHQNGICHRDLKPDNVLIKPNEKIRLMDFNISKRFFLIKDDAITPTIIHEDSLKLMNQNSSSNYNTPDKKQLKKYTTQEFDVREKKLKITMRTLTGLDQWSAPETRQGISYTESIDLWGLGCLLYYTITKQAPFNDNEEEELKRKVQECLYDEIPQNSLDYYSKEIFELLENLLVADPSQRYKIDDVMSSSWVLKEFKDDPLRKTEPRQQEKEIYISPKKQYRQELPLDLFKKLAGSDSKTNQNEATEIKLLSKPYRPRKTSDHDIQEHNYNNFFNDSDQESDGIISPRKKSSFDQKGKVSNNHPLKLELKHSQEVAKKEIRQRERDTAPRRTSFFMAIQNTNNDQNEKSRSQLFLQNDEAPVKVGNENFDPKSFDIRLKKVDCEKDGYSSDDDSQSNSSGGLRLLDKQPRLQNFADKKRKNGQIVPRDDSGYDEGPESSNNLLELEFSQNQSQKLKGLQQTTLSARERKHKKKKPIKLEQSPEMKQNVKKNFKDDEPIVQNK